jgi:hypothetical protein
MVGIVGLGHVWRCVGVGIDLGDVWGDIGRSILWGGVVRCAGETEDGDD